MVRGEFEGGRAVNGEGEGGGEWRGRGGGEVRRVWGKEREGR